MDEDSIVDFFNNRDKLINDLLERKIDKREFIDYSYNYIVNNKIKPFKSIDSFEKGMYNYQYYNVMAKYYKTLVSKMKSENKSEIFYNKYHDEEIFFYEEKDKVSFRLLRHIKFKNVEAYYIEMESKYLNNRLYEIVLKDYKYAVLHSMAEWLLNTLKKEGVFIDGRKKSIIDHYVNKDY